MTFEIEKLADDQQLSTWLTKIGVVDAKRGMANLRSIAESGLPSEKVQQLLSQLQQHLPAISDPDRSINNLERLISNSNVDVELSHSFPDLLSLFSTSQYLSDLLIRGEWEFQEAWRAKGNLLTREQTVELLVAEIQQAKNVTEAMKILRRFKHRETLRIGIGDLIVGWRLEPITDQISSVASAVVEAAYHWARNDLEKKLGEPLSSANQPSQFVVLAMGKLGGHELNYSSDIDLVMLYDERGMTNSTGLAKISNQEFFERLCRLMVKLIGETTELGAAYRVDLRLRPNGSSGKLCSPFQAMVQYYDLLGRTWERQALIKASPIAGDIELGKRLLDQLAPWIFRRNLSRADISGVKALKRKIERRAAASGEDRTNVKTGHGGIRDVEFIIQFLQLLNGGELPEVRTTNTLDAIRKLERAKCLSSAEATVLSQNYEWLRKLEHRLQMMFDLQTHTIPVDEIELRKIAIRMGFIDSGNQSALLQFQQTLMETTESNRKVLNHLLHGAFGIAFGSMRNTMGMPHRFDEQTVPLEVDLILDGDPDEGMVESVLMPYGFQNVNAAFSNLMDLAKEPTQFLSSRRCKHFLASVAPALLSELSQTPDPDQALVTLATVSDCLGAKGILWELFSFNPPTLSLYVRLCASSDYLVGILKSNPGMIDELVDALQLDALPSRDWLAESMDELSKGAVDLAPIIHSFKNTQHMRVGIRDILGRDDVRQTNQTLSHIAEICLQTVVQYLYQQLFLKHANSDSPDFSMGECPLVILGLGKLGGREPNYHSDLDVIFLYESDCEKNHQFRASLKEGVTGQFFFSELAAQLTQFFGHHPTLGRLYEIDSRLRPTGRSGSLAVSMEEFQRYFESGKGQLWERQALCKARPVFGADANRTRAMELVHRAIKTVEWNPEMAGQIDSMRQAMQNDASVRNLKRGEGGTVDVEFAIQMLQLKYARENDSVLVPGTLNAIEKLVEMKYLDSASGKRLSEGYQLLRSVEARLRLMNTTARHDLPEKEKSLAKLAYLLNFEDAARLEKTVSDTRTEIRSEFTRILN
ncbi:MAG: bifunctional [glutamate--ammonia ligase]-adenylyl-L-tyrosine phosphorylase/[glutamate--ammonia-ligase] adenylyltransferase [Mariniblastus sp.]